MWESGMDNSPAWDDALNRIHLSPGQIPQYTRVDKGKVGDHHERPSSHFYDRAVHLIKIFYDNNYDETAIFNKSPFIIQDVLFNSILARAGDALADIAHVLGKADDEISHRTRAANTAKAISSKLFHEEDGFFYDYDMVAKKLIRTKISGGLVGVFGAKMSADQLKSILAHLREPGFLGPDLSSFTIPSVSRDDPGYTNTTYWKGPAWININYLVRDGLLRHADGNQDAQEIASHLKERSIEMLKTSGFFEYFNPISGSPHGGHHFSWSAALTIDWMCNGSEPAQQALPMMKLVSVSLVLLAAVIVYMVSSKRGKSAASVTVHRKIDAAEVANKALAHEESKWTDSMALLHLRRRTRTPAVIRAGRSN
ncbi:Glycosyl hydrolase 63 [Gracilaria domingensis]|nr:Glycosyl hydrolase 63 [Gracilaria domingensis]